MRTKDIEKFVGTDEVFHIKEQARYAFPYYGRVLSTEVKRSLSSVSGVSRDGVLIAYCDKQGTPIMTTEVRTAGEALGIKPKFVGRYGYYPERLFNEHLKRPLVDDFGNAVTYEKPKTAVYRPADIREPLRNLLGRERARAEEEAKIEAKRVAAAASMEGFLSTLPEDLAKQVRSSVLGGKEQAEYLLKSVEDAQVEVLGGGVLVTITGLRGQTDHYAKVKGEWYPVATGTYHRGSNVSLRARCILALKA